jgi:hypothetical protein
MSNQATSIIAATFFCGFAPEDWIASAQERLAMTG